jgi:hypothetical protein
MAKRPHKSTHHGDQQLLANLENELLAAMAGQKITVPMAEVRKKGLLKALRERTPPMWRRDSR